MAKKKTSTASKPAARKTVPAKKATTKKAAAPKAPAKLAPLLCCEEVGNTAGKIWQFLSDNGEQTPAALKKAVDAPGDMVMAAIGWLAREEKLDFAISGRNVKIALR